MFKPVLDFLGKVLDKGGVQGLLLVLLLLKLHMADNAAEQRADREMARQERADSLARVDRRESSLAYRAQSDSLISLARSQAVNEARGIEAIRASARALRDNTRIVTPIAQRLGIRVNLREDG
jgi:hypothetical protein